MADLPEELKDLVEQGWNVEESEELAQMAPGPDYAGYLQAEPVEGGWGVGLAYRAGLGAALLATLAREAEARIDSLVTEGPHGGPYEWVERKHARGYYIWLRPVRLDPTLDI